MQFFSSFFASESSEQEDPVEMAEKRMLSSFMNVVSKSKSQHHIRTQNTVIEQKFVSYRSVLHKGEDGRINTMIIESKHDDAKKPDLVLLHGFCAALGFYIPNFSELSQHYRVIAVDLPLFGRSSRHHISFQNGEEAEQYFVESLSQFCDNIGVTQPFFLAGHSFGGYLASCFALKFPEKVEHLVLLDPWGMEGKKLKTKEQLEKESYLRKFVTIASEHMGPFSLIRNIPESYGKRLISRLRGDILEKFAPYFDQDHEEIVMNYLYEINVQHPATGEDAFRALSEPIAYAKNPLEDRLKALDKNVRLSFLFGEYTWMSKSAGLRVFESRIDGKTGCYSIIPNAGHHIYADNALEFNRQVINCKYNKT